MKFKWLVFMVEHPSSDYTNTEQFRIPLGIITASEENVLHELRKFVNSKAFLGFHGYVDNVAGYYAQYISDGDDDTIVIPPALHSTCVYILSN